jgi:hypothetical protein
MPAWPTLLFVLFLLVHPLVPRYLGRKSRGACDLLSLPKESIRPV